MKNLILSLHVTVEMLTMQFLQEMDTTMMGIAYEWSFPVVDLEEVVVEEADSVVVVVDSEEGTEAEEVVAGEGEVVGAVVPRQDGQITEP